MVGCFVHKRGWLLEGVGGNDRLITGGRPLINSMLIMEEEGSSRASQHSRRPKLAAGERRRRESEKVFLVVAVLSFSLSRQWRNRYPPPSLTPVAEVLAGCTLLSKEY